MSAHLLQRLDLDQVSLFLDLDGTLAPFAPTPEGVGPDAERNARLRRMAQRLGGRLAVISGRSLADLDRILEDSVDAVAGSHGLQRRDLNRRQAAVLPHPRLSQAVAEIESFAGRFKDVRVERKPLSVAFHYRGNAAVALAAEVFTDDLARRTGLRLQKGAMVAELVTPGADKGEAMRAFMTEAPFAGTVPVFVGDDLTDEDGFVVAASCGGFGVVVGPPRPTAAQFRLEGAASVHAWLEQALETNHLVLEYPVEPSYRRI